MICHLLKWWIALVTWYEFIHKNKDTSAVQEQGWFFIPPAFLNSDVSLSSLPKLQIKLKGVEGGYCDGLYPKVPLNAHIVRSQ